MSTHVEQVERAVRALRALGDPDRPEVAFFLELVIREALRHRECDEDPALPPAAKKTKIRSPVRGSGSAAAPRARRAEDAHGIGINVGGLPSMPSFEKDVLVEHEQQRWFVVKAEEGPGEWLYTLHLADSRSTICKKLWHDGRLQVGQDDDVPLGSLLLYRQHHGDRGRTVCVVAQHYDGGYKWFDVAFVKSGVFESTIAVAKPQDD